MSAIVYKVTYSSESVCDSRRRQNNSEVKFVEIDCNFYFSTVFIVFFFKFRVQLSGIDAALVRVGLTKQQELMT